MSVIRVEHHKPAAESPASATTAPPEWKWDTLPVLKEVVEVETTDRPQQSPPLEDAA